MSKFLGKLSEGQSEDDDWRSHLMCEPSEGDWCIRWDFIRDDFVECICVFYDSAVCFTAVPLADVKQRITEVQ